MFKVAPRYLSGVSVFYGDDITRRETEGELVVFIGQAAKGPRVPVQLKSVDNAIAIYGTDNPLVKALYEFYDGYIDAGQKQPLKFVTLRIGGTASSFETSYGLELETTDAYDGIENDYFIYVNNQPADINGNDRAGVKIWDKNKRIVYNSYSSIDSGHVTVASLPTGTGNELAIYGVDIDEDILETPVSIGSLVNLDIVNPTGSALTTAGIAIDATEVVVAEAITEFPLTGTLKVTEVTGAIETVAYASYENTALNVVAKTFKLSSEIGTVFTAAATISLVGSTLVAGDSQLSLTNQDIYGKMRNGLLDLEMYTPDYIVPGGVAYNTTNTFLKPYTKSTLLKVNLADTDSVIVVDAASTWPSAGTINIFDGTDHNLMKYTLKEVYGTDYKLTLAKPTFNITSIGPTGGADAYKTVAVTGTGATVIGDLLSSGYVKIGDTVHLYTSVSSGGELTLSTQVAVGDRASITLQKVAGVALKDITTVTTSYNVLENMELGIGYVKETDNGDSFSFEWSNTKLAGYNIAHFGYLFANFCNEAAVGYNTPLCGMNVDISSLVADNFSRASIKNWIGVAPTYQVRVDNDQAVEAVSVNGTGLLGEATLVGSSNFNRCYMNNAAEGSFADPAFGLLMTDEGFVDGHELTDTYSKVVDLGKFLCVGAGLLTFGNRATNKAYIDTCGIYSIGQLAGKAKNEGLSFSRIASASNTNVSVVVTRALYNDLAKAGYIVVTREKGLGWVINNANSAVREQSGYFLISTTRTIKYIIESKRSILVSFIGKPVSRLLYEAARTRLAESFTADVANGLLANNPVWDLVVVQAANAIGKFELKCSLDPALELTQVDIDAVIERTANIV